MAEETKREEAVESDQSACLTGRQDGGQTETDADDDDADIGYSHDDELDYEDPIADALFEWEQSAFDLLKQAPKGGTLPEREDGWMRRAECVLREAAREHPDEHAWMAPFLDGFGALFVRLADLRPVTQPYCAVLRWDDAGGAAHAEAARRIVEFLVPFGAKAMVSENTHLPLFPDLPREARFACVVHLDSVRAAAPTAPFFL